ncbi:major facilitator superfamily domain-containing protein [Jimgerdemannia flammicorona]|uniref:Major facilitator superfamily domain-containing protein n=2 Tax=Jimgerdemannia flammicorona TaxID=994334 RepID=A0A433QZF4_9FUNG|nr:major facilitator superfamily domain-containing protein [Jimgerdemannia flammicorona]RUS35121.1 major facilitator superfamily domain-containing protein [Jimgerdemannia flammicorona]
MSDDNHLTQISSKRLFGTISCGLTAAILGLLIDAFHTVQISFLIYAIAISAFLVLIFRTPPNEFSPSGLATTRSLSSNQEGIPFIQDPLDTDSEQGELTFAITDSDGEDNPHDSDHDAVLVKSSRNTTTPHFGAALANLLTHPPFIFFLFITFLMGVGRSAASNFLFLYLETLGASRSLMGLNHLCGISLEVMCFQMSDRLLKTVGSFFFAPLDLLFTSPSYSIHSPPPQPHPHRRFALFWSGGAHFVTNITPLDLQTTAVGVYSGIYYGIGGGLGGIVGGAVYNSYGPAALYRCIAALATLTFLVYWIGEPVIVGREWRLWGPRRYRRVVKPRSGVEEGLEDEAELGMGLVAMADE